MPFGGLTKTVTVNAEPAANTSRIMTELPSRGERQASAPVPSANVHYRQRRAAGVLPVRMDVPRSGTSHRFTKPLVIDEETAVTFRYRRR